MTEIDLKALFSANVKEQRALNRGSQMALAELIDVSNNTVPNIEIDKKFVTADTLACLACAFQFDACQLFLPKYIPPYEAVLSYCQNVKNAANSITAKYLKNKLH